MSDEPKGSVTKAVPCQDFSQLLVAIAQRRDREAFGVLFDYFAPRLNTMFRKSGSPPARAEELVQETLLTVWHKAGLFDPAGASASGWIYRIATNLRIDSIRRDRFGPSVEFESDLMPDMSPLPDAVVMAVQSGKNVGAAVAKLSAEQQQVIRLSYFEDAAHSEIAERLHLPLGTVKSRLRLALKHLRDLLEDLS